MHSFRLKKNMCVKRQICIIKTVGGGVLTRFCLKNKKNRI